MQRALAALLAVAAAVASAASPSLDFSDEGAPPLAPRFSEVAAGATFPAADVSWFEPNAELLLEGTITRRFPAASFRSGAAGRAGFAEGKVGVVVRDSFDLAGQPYPTASADSTAWRAGVSYPVQGFQHVVPYEFVTQVVVWKLEPCLSTTPADPTPPSMVYNQLHNKWGRTAVGAGGLTMGVSGGVLAMQNCLQAHGVRVSNAYVDPGRFYRAFLAASPDCVDRAAGTFGDIKKCRLGTTDCNAGWSHRLTMVTAKGGDTDASFAAPVSEKRQWLADAAARVEAGGNVFVTVAVRNSGAAGKAGADLLAADVHHVCVSPGVATTCDEYRCESESHQKTSEPAVNAMTKCYDPLNCQQTCCERTCSEFFLSKHQCPAGVARLTGVDDVKCGSLHNCARQCCNVPRPTCAEWNTESPGQCGDGRHFDAAKRGAECRGEECKAVCCATTMCSDWLGDSGKCPAASAPDPSKDMSATACGASCAESCCAASVCRHWFEQDNSCPAGRARDPALDGEACEGAACAAACCKATTCEDWMGGDGKCADGTRPAAGADMASIDCGAPDAPCQDRCCAPTTCRNWFEDDKKRCAAGSHRAGGAAGDGAECAGDAECQGKCCEPDTCAHWLGALGQKCAAGTKVRAGAEAAATECAGDECAAKCCEPETCGDWFAGDANQCPAGRSLRVPAADGEPCADAAACAQKCCREATCDDWTGQCAADRRPADDAGAKPCVGDACLEACCAPRTCADVFSGGFKCPDTHRPADEPAAAAPCGTEEECAGKCCVGLKCSDWKGQCGEGERRDDAAAAQPCAGDEQCGERCCARLTCADWEGACGDGQRPADESAGKECHGDDACREACCADKSCSDWFGGGAKCASGTLREEGQDAAACAGDEQCQERCCGDHLCGDWFAGEGECAAGSHRQAGAEGLACGTDSVCQSTCCGRDTCAMWKETDGAKCPDRSLYVAENADKECHGDEACHLACCADQKCSDFFAGDGTCGDGKHRVAAKDGTPCIGGDECVEACCAVDVCLDWYAAGGACAEGSLRNGLADSTPCHGERCQTECCTPQTCAVFLERGGTCAAGAAPKAGAEAETCAGEAQCREKCCASTTCASYFGSAGGACTAPGHVRDPSKDAAECAGDECGTACCRQHTCDDWFGDAEPAGTDGLFEPSSYKDVVDKVPSESSSDSDAHKPGSPDGDGPDNSDGHKPGNLDGDGPDNSDGHKPGNPDGDGPTNSDGDKPTIDKPTTDDPQKPPPPFEDGETMYAFVEVGSIPSDPTEGLNEANTAVTDPVSGSIADPASPTTAAAPGNVCPSQTFRRPESGSLPCTGDNCASICCSPPTCAMFFAVDPVERTCPFSAGSGGDSGKSSAAMNEPTKCKSKEECLAQCCGSTCATAWTADVCGDPAAGGLAKSQSAAMDTACTMTADCRAKCCEERTCAAFWASLDESAERCPATSVGVADADSVRCGADDDCRAKCCAPRSCAQWRASDSGQCAAGLEFDPDAEDTACGDDASCAKACCVSVDVTCAAFWAQPGCPDSRPQQVEGADAAERTCGSKAPGGDCEAACCAPPVDRPTCRAFWSADKCADGQTEAAENALTTCSGEQCREVCCRDTCATWTGTCVKGRQPLSADQAAATECSGASCADACCTKSNTCSWFHAQHGCADGTTKIPALHLQECATRLSCQGSCCRDRVCRDVFDQCAPGTEPRAAAADTKCASPSGCQDDCCVAPTCAAYWLRTGGCPVGLRKIVDKSLQECRDDAKCVEACCERGTTRGSTCGEYFGEGGTCPADSFVRGGSDDTPCIGGGDCAAKCCGKCECESRAPWMHLRAGGPFRESSQCCEGTCASWHAENAQCPAGSPVRIDDAAIPCASASECASKCCRGRSCDDFYGASAAGACGAGQVPSLTAPGEAERVPCADDASCRGACCVPETVPVDTCEKFFDGGGQCGAGERPDAASSSRDCRGEADCRQKCCAGSCSSWHAGPGPKCRADQHESYRYKDDDAAARLHACKGLDCVRECCVTAEPSRRCAEFWQRPGCRQHTERTEGADSTECVSGAACQEQCCRQRRCRDHWARPGCLPSRPSRVTERANEPCEGLECARKCCAPPEPAATCDTWLRRGHKCPDNRLDPAAGVLRRPCGGAGAPPCLERCCAAPPPPKKCSAFSCASGTKSVAGSSALECRTPAECQGVCCEARSCIDFFSSADCAAGSVRKTGVLALQCGGDPSCQAKCCGAPPPHTCSKWRADAANKCVAGTRPKAGTDDTGCATQWQCRERCCEAETCANFWEATDCRAPASARRAGRGDTPCVGGAQCAARCCRAPTCADHYASPGCDEGSEVPRFSAAAAALRPCGPAGCGPTCCKPKPHRCAEFYAQGDGCPSTHGRLAGRESASCGGRADCVRKCCGVKTCGFWLSERGGGKCQAGFLARKDRPALAQACAGDEQCHPKCCREETCRDFFARSRNRCPAPLVPRWRTLKDAGVTRTKCGEGGCADACCKEAPPTCGDFFGGAGCAADTTKARANVAAAVCADDAECQAKCCVPLTCGDFFRTGRCPADREPHPPAAVQQRKCAGDEECAAQCCRPRTCMDWYAKNRCPAQHRSKFKHKRSAGSAPCGTECEAVCCDRVETCQTYFGAGGNRCSPGRQPRQGVGHVECRGAQCEQQCCFTPTCASFFGTHRCAAGTRPAAGAGAATPCGSLQECTARCCAPRTCNDYYRSPGCNRGFAPVFRLPAQAAAHACGADPQCHQQCCAQQQPVPTCAQYRCAAGSAPQAGVGHLQCQGLACQQQCCAPTTCAHFWGQARCPAGAMRDLSRAATPCQGEACAQQCCKTPTCAVFYGQKSKGGGCSAGSTRKFADAQAAAAHQCANGSCQDECCETRAPTCQEFFKTSACAKGRLPDPSRSASECTGTACQQVCCSPYRCSNFFASGDCGFPSTRRAGAEQVACEGEGCQEACCEVPPRVCADFKCVGGLEADPSAAAEECLPTECEGRCCREKQCSGFTCPAGLDPRPDASKLTCGPSGDCAAKCCQPQRTCADFFAGSDCPPAKRRRASAGAGLKCEHGTCERHCCEPRPSCALWWTSQTCPAGTTPDLPRGGTACEGGACAEHCCRAETCGDFFGRADCPAGRRRLSGREGAACTGAACELECCAGEPRTCAAYFALGEECPAGKRRTARADAACEGGVLCAAECCVDKPHTCQTHFEAEECPAGTEPRTGELHKECTECAAECCRPTAAPTCAAFLAGDGGGCAEGTAPRSGTGGEECVGDCQETCCEREAGTCGDFFGSGAACGNGTRPAAGHEDRVCAGAAGCASACCEAVPALTCARFVARDGCPDGHAPRAGSDASECEEDDDCAGVCCEPAAEPACLAYFDGGGACPAGRTRAEGTDAVPCEGEAACGLACCSPGPPAVLCQAFFAGGGACEPGHQRQAARDGEECGDECESKCCEPKRDEPDKTTCATFFATEAEGCGFGRLPREGSDGLECAGTENCRQSCCHRVDVRESCDDFTCPAGHRRRPDAGFCVGVDCAERCCVRDAGDVCSKHRCRNGTRARAGMAEARCHAEECQTQCCEEPPKTDCAGFFARHECGEGSARRGTNATVRCADEQDCRAQCCAAAAGGCAAFFEEQECPAGQQRRDDGAGNSEAACCKPGGGRPQEDTCAAFFKAHTCPAGEERTPGAERQPCCQPSDRRVPCTEYFRAAQCERGTVRRAGYAGETCSGGTCQAKCCERPAGMTCEVFHETGGCPYGTSLGHVGKDKQCDGELACISECCVVEQHEEEEECDDCKPATVTEKNQYITRQAEDDGTAPVFRKKCVDDELC